MERTGFSSQCKMTNVTQGFESDMNLAQHWSFVLAFHCTAPHSRRLHVTVGSQQSSRSPGRKQKQKKYWLLQQLRKSGRNSIQIGSIERQATKTLFATVSPKFPDSGMELLQLYLQSIILVRDCPVIFSSFLVVSCNQGAVRINDTSLRLLLTVDDWGVLSCPDTSNVNESLSPLQASTRRQRQRHCRSLSRWCTCSRVAFLPLRRWLLSRGETNRPWKMLDRPRSGIIWHHFQGEILVLEGV